MRTADARSAALDPGLVLVVDDDDDIRLALKELLERAGYRVRAAADGVEALAVLDEVLPGLVLLDLMMPRLDGEETLRRLREKPGHEATTVVFLTASGREVGDAPTVRKPFSFDALLAVVQQYCPPAPG